MANRNQSSQPQEPQGADPSIEARLTALERRMAERSEAWDTSPGETRSADRAELSEELAQYRNQLRDYEKALVDRIADVDDDRRSTASRLQRAWRNQRQETDARLRRFLLLTVLLLSVFAVCFLIGLFVVYKQAASGRSELEAQVSELRAAMTRPPAQNELGDGVRDRLEQLEARIAEIASSSREMAESGERAVQASVSVERKAREAMGGRLAEDIAELAARQERLAAAIESLLPPDAGEAVDPVTAAKVIDGDGSTRANREGERIVASADDERQPEAASAVVASSPTESDTGTGGDQPGDGETTLVVQDGYGLQLIGFFSLEAMQEFVAREELPEGIYYARESYKGRPWYAIIYSLHDSLAEATSAASRLPPELAELEPWVRPLPAGTRLWIIDSE